MCGVSGAVVLGDQHLDRLAKQLVSPIAEQAFRQDVDQANRTVPVDDHHRVRGRFQRLAKGTLRAARVVDRLCETKTADDP